MGLNTLKVDDSFRAQAEPTEKFEILIKSKSTIFALSVEGKVSKINPETMVLPSHTRHLEQYLCSLIICSLILKRIATEIEVDAFLTNEVSFIGKFNMCANDFKAGESYDGNLMSVIESQWRDHVDILTGEYKMSKRKVINKYMDRAYVIVDVIRRSYKISVDEHFEGQRTSLEAENELKPIHALIDDTSFEAQVFANGLAMSALIATLVLALNFPEETSILLSVIISCKPSHTRTKPTLLLSA